MTDPQSPQRGPIGRSFIGKHWRGEYSLPIAYWVVGILSALALFAFVFSLVLLASEYRPVSGLVVIVAIWAAFYILMVWSTVGTWISASKHVERGGKKVWAVLAQISLVLGLLQAGATTVRSAVPQIRNSVAILQGDEEIGATHFRLINSTELELTGGITFGADEQLTALLDQNPDIKVIHLNSHGGRLQPALKLRDLILERGLDTFTSDLCASACTVAYLGGTQRYLHPATGRLGFHAMDAPGIDQYGMVDVQSEIVKEVVAFDVDEDFAKRAYEVPHEEVWIPTHQELFDAGYITALSHGQFALSGYGPVHDFDEIERTQLAQPVYEALRKNKPEIYAPIAAALKKGVEAGIPEQEVIGAMRGMMAAAVTAELPKANNDNIKRFADVIIEQMQEINAKSPVACHAYLFPTEENFVDPRTILSPELLNKELALYADMFGSPDPEPPVAASDAHLEMLLHQVFESIQANYPPETLTGLGGLGDTTPPEQSCDAALAFYSTIRQLPDEDAGNLLRHILGP